MYEAFFSLEDSPFVLTPDPRFLLRSKGHHEILSSLLYGITSQKGLMALIGDVGTGKTTLCRALLRELPADVQSALVLNPHLSDVELMGTILDDLGVDRRGAATKGELMTVLNQHLLAVGEEGKTVVVVLDEAQQMSDASLEQIRILSTLETATRKLLQIVLVGQPELEDTLRRRELRQLDQRIGIRCYLTPLARKETFRYVEHRLRVAGLPGAVPFSRAALARIHRISGGVPRVINLLCDRALMAAFGVRAHEVTPALVRAAARNLDGRGGARRRRAFAPQWPALRRLALAAGLAGIVVLAGALGMSWLPGRTQPGPAVATPVAMLSAPAAERLEPAPAVAPVPVPPPVADARGVEPVRALLARLLRLWGVSEELDGSAIAAWPTLPGGALDVAAVAGRYHLAATFLADTSIGDVRAVGLPVLVDVEERGVRQALLLRRMGRDAAVLVTAAGEERQVPLDQLEGGWTRSAWVLWRNVDLLPTDPATRMTPTVATTVSLRLTKLGFPGERLDESVRRFQRANGLTEDGIMGPRTTLALARATTGPFGPSLAGPPR